MESRVFQKFSDIIYRESGIVLPPEKKTLLSSRIQKRLNSLKIQNEADYLNIIELDASGDELSNLIDSISTNVTYFYREQAHFEIYKKILKSWESSKNEIKIWCAASSSGEEPYTLAFEAANSIDLEKTNLKILATDICTKVLKKAVDARYSKEAISKIPRETISKYFQQISDSSPLDWKVVPEITKLVLFKKLNLISFPYPLKGPIDIIFCRNVMIYFDQETRAKIINEMSKLLSPGGYLFLSHSENLLGINHNFEKCDASVFKKKS